MRINFGQLTLILIFSRSNVSNHKEDYILFLFHFSIKKNGFELDLNQTFSTKLP